MIRGKKWEHNFLKRNIDIMPPLRSLEDTTKISSPSRLNEMAKDVFIDF